MLWFFLFSNHAKVNNIQQNWFEKLLAAALPNNFYNFEGKMNKWIDGEAMRSPLGPTLANVSMNRSGLLKIPCSFWTLYLPEPPIVSKYLLITNPHLVDYIQILTVSFPNNIKMVWFSLYYFERFQLFQTFQDLIQRCAV